MPRLLPLLLFIGLCFWLISRMSALPRSDRTYRPRPRWPDWFGADEKAAEPGTVHIVKRGELAGLRDAYSSAPIDAAKPLFRCGKCLSMYHADSVAVLKRENGGCCMVCGGTDLGPVRLADD
ncbi:MAG: hypothetical protein MUF80_05455 [Burkholderiales bacterium]|jgi:hypothetical protein|nr:hypothetical protein [Burkholderiales bacterium]